MESKGMMMESRGMSTRAGMSNIETPDYPAASIFPRKCIQHGGRRACKFKTVVNPPS